MVDEIADRKVGARAGAGEMVIGYARQHFDHCLTCGVQIDHWAPSLVGSCHLDGIDGQQICDSSVAADRLRGVSPRCRSATLNNRH
jgi:hypothetical protein